MSTVSIVDLPQLPAEAADAYRRGWSIFPVGSHKRPLLTTWKPYQEHRATPKELAAWATGRDLAEWAPSGRPAAWAVITGRVSGLVILDFDGNAGKETAERLAIRPHVRTGSGGLHWYGQAPAWYVPTLNAKTKASLGEQYPGLDIRGDGGYAVFTGRNDAGAYTWLRPMEPDPLEVLPAAVREFLSLDQPPSTTTPPPTPAPPAAARSARPPAESAADFIERQLAAAIQRAATDGRNNACFWLCCQLRDADASEQYAAVILGRFVSAMPLNNSHGKHEPFTEREAAAALRQAYRAPKREAARDQSRPAPARRGRPPATAEDNGHQAPTTGPGRPKEKQPHECMRTDLGNAERLVLRFGRNLRYCHPWKQWVIWDGRRWKTDDTAAASRFAIASVKLMWDEVKAIEDADTQKALAKWAVDSQAAGRLQAMLQLARSFESVSITPDLLDADPWVLNVNNGTLDLRTGQLRKQDRGDLITKLAPVDYDAEAPCPTWMKFLDSLMLGRPGLVEYLQRAIGYSLTGDVSLKKLFVCFGGGDNGKTTMLETVRFILGDYAGSIPIQSLLHTRQAAGRDASPDIAALRGRRFVTTSEADDGARLNESLIKHLTGMGEISCRDLYSGQFTFMPSHKLFLDTNHKPTVRGTDKGIWTRLRLIPFELQLKESQKDTALLTKLEAEAAGILTWAVWGCLDWLREGFAEPEEVQAATKEYRADMDTLRHFLDECTDDTDPDYRAGARDLYRAYHAWSTGAGEYAISERKFSEAMAERRIRKHRGEAGNQYHGLRLTVELSDRGEIRQRRLI